MKGYAKPARKGIIMTDPNTITAKSNNERHLSEVLHTLRKVTSATTDDDKARIVLYLDSIAVEIERINATRTPLLGLEACKKCRREFDDTDIRWDGQARYKETPFCRRCVDFCYESNSADHRCPVCAEKGA
jgi:hypothetical protein